MLTNVTRMPHVKLAHLSRIIHCIKQPNYYNCDNEISQGGIKINICPTLNQVITTKIKNKRVSQSCSSHL